MIEMTPNNLTGLLKTLLIILMMYTMTSCNTAKKDADNHSAEAVHKASPQVQIPDSVIQFLITSAANDFNEHRPPTVIDIRNVKVGYLLLDDQSGYLYLICGEYLSLEKNEWEPFETIKTSGYEQYLGNVNCGRATMVLTDEPALTTGLKNKLASLNIGNK